MPDNLIYAGSRHRIRRWRNYGITSGPPAVPVVFLFRDDFLTDEAAPLTSPRTAEPGPGIGTITDGTNIYSIGSDDFIVNGTPAANSGISYDPVSRIAGLCAYFVLSGFTANVGNNAVIGFADNVTPSVINMEFAAVILPTNTDLWFANAGHNLNLGTLLNNNAFIILRSAGAFFIINSTLYWVENTDNTATLYPAIYTDGNGAQARIFNFGTFRGSQLPFPWDTDFGIATDRLAGARIGGDTYIHEADFLGEFTVTTVPVAGTIFWTFRQQDATNYWEVIVTPAQDITLREVVAGVPTARGTALGVINNGDRVVVIADGTTIRVYEQNTLRITYALAANFQTETDGELQSVGVGGAVDDIVTWPRVISNAALRALNRVADA